MAVDGMDGRYYLIVIDYSITIAESGNKERRPGVSTRLMIDDSAWVWSMSGLTRDGTAGLSRETGTGKPLFG